MERKEEGVRARPFGGGKTRRGRLGRTWRMSLTRELKLSSLMLLRRKTIWALTMVTSELPFFSSLACSLGGAAGAMPGGGPAGGGSELRPGGGARPGGRARFGGGGGWEDEFCIDGWGGGSPTRAGHQPMGVCGTARQRSSGWREDPKGFPGGQGGRGGRGVVIRASEGPERKAAGVGRDEARREAKTRAGLACREGFDAGWGVSEGSSDLQVVAREGELKAGPREGGSRPRARAAGKSPRMRRNVDRLA